MPRRSGKTVTENAAETAPVEDATTESENAVTTTTDETAEAVSEELTTEATENAAAEGETAEATSEEKVDPDISALRDALSAIIDGDISDLDALDFKPVVEAYNALDRAGKAFATRYMGNLSPELLEGGDFDKARVVLLANKATKASPPKGERAARTPKEPVNPTEAFVEKLASFQLAYALFSATKPEGVAEDWQEQVNAMYSANYDAAVALAAYVTNTDENKGDEPEASDVAVAAVRIATKPSRKTYGPRHDVTNHIVQVFAELESGTFLTISDIANRPSEEYGPEGATASAVTARVTKAKKPLPEGLTVETVGDDTGVRKA